MRFTTETLRRETAGLATALRRPQVRGRWGELHLRKAVELAGMVSRCDFDEQRTVLGGLRPDLVVNLAGGKHVIVDAKVPLDAFLDATTTDDPDEYAAFLARHARQLRQHVDALSNKEYWRALPSAPEFVVLFVPGESFLSAALESRARAAGVRRSPQRHPGDTDDPHRPAPDRRPRLEAGGCLPSVRWRSPSSGRELHDRLGIMGTHLDRLGRSLTASVGAFNAAVGSLETRVLVSARRFHRPLAGSRQGLETPRAVEDVTARALRTRAARGRRPTADPRRVAPRRGVGRAGAGGSPTLDICPTTARCGKKGATPPAGCLCVSALAALLVVLLNLVGAGQIGALLRPVVRADLRGRRARDPAAPSSSSSASCRRCCWRAPSSCWP